MTQADERDIDALPVNLRALLTAELAAGNEIIEVGHTFPAPPAGAYVKLAKPLQTRDGGLPVGVHYFDRKGSSYSGEITDAKRFYFLLEPPHPPEPEPDMDAIRAAVNAASGFTPPVAITHAATAESAPASFEHTTLIEKFERSMVIDYEKWHDGIGYDLDVLRQMSAAEKKMIESMLIRRGLRDWRDVEALAEIDSPTAHTALKAAINHSNVEIRNAVTRHAPELIAPAVRARSLVRGIETADIFGGLSQTLDQVAEFHPPEVVEALFRGVLHRPGDVAVHLAAMLFYVYGKTTAPFDMAERPFFLRFNTAVEADRMRAFRELCKRIGVDAARFIPDDAAEEKSSVGRQSDLAYYVDVDGRGETLTYHEADRSAQVICTFGAAPRILARTLSDWWYPATQHSALMAADERPLILARIADYCRSRLGMTHLKFEPQSSPPSP